MAESTVRVVFLGDSAQASRAVGKLESSFSALGRTAKLAGLAIAGALVAGLTMAAKEAIGFDTALTDLNQVAKLSEKQLQALGTQILALAKQTGQGPSSLAEAMKQVVAVGFKTGQALTIVKEAGKAATATNSSLADTTGAVITVMKQYGAEAGTARQVTDVLTNAVEHGNTSFADLRAGLAQVLPVAHALKLPISDVAGALTFLSQQGVPVTRASMSIRMVLGALLKPNKDLAAALKQVGDAEVTTALKSKGFGGVMGDLIGLAKTNPDLVAKWFPARSSAVVFDIAKHLTDFNGVLKQSADATRGAGATAEAYATHMQSLGAQWNNLKVTLAAAAVPIGQLLIPVLSKAVSALSFLATEIGKVTPQIRTGFNAISSAGATVANVIASNWPRITAAARNVWQFIVAQFGPPVIAIIQSVGRIAMTLVQVIRDNWPQIATIARSLGTVVAAAFKVIASVVKALAPIVQALKPVFALVFKSLELTMQGAAAVARIEGPIISGAISTAGAVIAGAVNGIKSVLGTLGAAFSAAASAAQKAASTIVGAFKTVWGWISRAWDWVFHIRIPIPHFSISFGGFMGVIPHVSAGITWETFAKGGFIPGGDGAPVPILAHAGEVVLNKAQQAALGGAGAIAQLFGFSPPSGQREFAAGGFVGGPKKSAKSPHHPVSYKKPLQYATAAVNKVDAALAAIIDVISRADRSYGQQVREDDITQEQFLIDIPNAADAALQDRIEADRKAIEQEKAKANPDKNAIAGWTRDINDAQSQMSGQPTITVVDQAAVSQRLNEIAGLVKMRGDMLALLDEKKADLDLAIKDLKKAIAAVKKAIAEEQRRIEDDTKAILKLQADIKERQARVDKDRQDVRDEAKIITGLEAQVSSERGKKKPDRAAIARLEEQIKAHKQRKTDIGDLIARELIGESKDRSNIGLLTQDRSAHRTQLGKLQTELKDWTGALADRGRDERDWPLDVRDVNLDIETLNYEAGQIRAIKAPPLEIAGTAGSIDGGTVDTSGTGGGGGGGTGADHGQAAADIAALQAIIAQLRQALSIQTAQTAVIGSFKTGTLHVPSTGPYLLHAGERVMPAGIPDWKVHVGGPNVTVRVDGDGVGAMLADYIHVEIDKAQPRISRQMGITADRYAREGRR